MEDAILDASPTCSSEPKGPFRENSSDTDSDDTDRDYDCDCFRVDKAK
jgi:hypothetical protein